MIKESDTSIRQPDIIFDGLIKAAERGDPLILNENIKSICNEFEFIGWALICGISNKDEHVRDFAMTFVEMSRCEFNSVQVGILKNLMQKDKNPDIRHTTGFILFRHGVRSKDVIKTIKKTLKDPNLDSILKEKARGCLDQLKNERQKTS